MFVRSGPPAQQHPESPLDSAEQLLAEVEALIDAFGETGFVAAVRKSRVAERLDHDGGVAALRVAQTLLPEISRAKSARLQAEVMATAVGLHGEKPETMGKIAKRHGITKQAYSKRVIAYCDANGLPPSPMMRKAKDRETYRLTNQPKSA